MKKGLFIFATLVALVGCKTTQTAQAPIYKLKVERGDTLADIAKKYDTTWQEIVRLNKLEDVRGIYIGQIIRVKPGPAGVVAGAKVVSSKGAQGARSTSNSVRSDGKKSAKRPGLLFGRSSAGFTWPVKGRISSGFGPRWGRMHKGIDISAPSGTKIGAARAGKVTFVGWKRGYGKTIIVTHDKTKSLYAHCSKILVDRGDYVDLGQIIGKVGTTGNARGAHLHFEIQSSNGKRFNPRRYLPSKTFISSL